MQVEAVGGSGEGPREEAGEEEAGQRGPRPPEAGGRRGHSGLRRLLRQLAGGELDFDGAAGHPVAGVAGGQRVRVAAAAQVVLVRVHHHGLVDDAVRPRQRDDAVLGADVRHAVRAGHDVAQVADVPLRVLGAAVLLVFGVEVAARGRAPRAHVAVLVHVEAVLPRGQPRHVAVVDDGAVAQLVEDDGARGAALQLHHGRLPFSRRLGESRGDHGDHRQAEEGGGGGQHRAGACGR